MGKTVRVPRPKALATADGETGAEPGYSQCRSEGPRTARLPDCPVRSSGVDEVAVSTTGSGVYPGSGVYSGMRRMAGTEWTYRHSDLPRASLNC